MENVEDNSVDGVYALESTCHSSDPLIVYKELFRVMKPGALCIDSAWVMTDKYQPGNPEHEKIKHDIEVCYSPCSKMHNDILYNHSLVMDCLSFVQMKLCLQR